MWHRINRVIKRKSPSTLHHSSARTQDLVNTWSEHAHTRNLPPHIEEALSTHRNVRTLGLMTVLLHADEDDNLLIAEDGQRRALARGKATAPEDDGVHPPSPLSPLHSRW